MVLTFKYNYYLGSNEDIELEERLQPCEDIHLNLNVKGEKEQKSNFKSRTSKLHLWLVVEGFINKVNILWGYQDGRVV